MGFALTVAQCRNGNCLIWHDASGRHELNQFNAHNMAMHASAVTFPVQFPLFLYVILFMVLLGFAELFNVFDWLRRQLEVFLLRETAPQMNSIFDQL